MSKLELPEGREREFALKDGAIVHFKELKVEDGEALERFVDSLSEDAIYFRFLMTGIDRGVLIEQLSPKPESFTLVALKGGQIVGHAAYYRNDAETAEVGLLVIDDYQGRGLGTTLTERIARSANGEGISMFETIIGWNNTRMIRMVRDMGFPTSERVEPDLIRIRFPTSIDPLTIKEFQDKWVFLPDE